MIEFDEKLYDELYPDLSDDELTDMFIVDNYYDLYLESLENGEN